MLHTWKPLHSLSISHVFRTEGAPCLPAEEQSKLPHGDQRERQGQEHACPHAGWFVLWGQLLPKPGLLVGCNRCSAIQPQIPHWPGNRSGRVRQRGVQTASCDSFAGGSCGSCSGVVWSRAILQNRDCFHAQGELRLQTPQHTLRIRSLPHQHHCCPTASAVAEENAVQLHCRLQEGPRKTRTLCC